MKFALCIAPLLIIGCSGSVGSTATVTDPTAAFADSESAALAGQGREHLVKGCVVQILRTTDRAARVKAMKCPDDSGMVPLDRWPGGTEGWVAKSALSL